MNLLTEPIGLSHYLIVGAILFVSGVVCMATKRNALGVLMGIELVLNGANVNFVAFGSDYLRPGVSGIGLDGQCGPVRDRAGRGRSRRGPGHYLELLQQPRHGRRRPGRRAQRLMDPVTALPKLLGLAWLLPLASFTLIVFFGPRMGKAGSLGRLRGHRRHPDSCVLSLVALLCVWMPNYGGCRATAVALTKPARRAAADRTMPRRARAAPAGACLDGVKPITGDWYTLAQFGSLAADDRLLHRLADRADVLPWSR